MGLLSCCLFPTDATPSSERSLTHAASATPVLSIARSDALMWRQRPNTIGATISRWGGTALMALAPPITAPATSLRWRTPSLSLSQKCCSLGLVPSQQGWLTCPQARESTVTSLCLSPSHPKLHNPGPKD